jgi:hypothetical protein
LSTVGELFHFPEGFPLENGPENEKCIKIA